MPEMFIVGEIEQEANGEYGLGGGCFKSIPIEETV